MSDEVPFLLQSEFGDPVEKFRVIGDAGGIQHRSDVVEVFLRATFPEKQELVDDHGFRGSKPSVAERAGQLAAVGEFPAGERAFPGQVAVCAHRTVLMYDIEMPPGLSLNFCEKNLLRRQVEILDRERADERLYMTRPEGKDKIGI